MPRIRTDTIREVEAPLRKPPFDLVERLIKFYSRVQKPELLEMWESIVALQHGSVFEAFLNKDVEKATDQLTRIYDTDLSGLNIGIVSRSATPESWCSFLEQAACAVGTLPAHNPEQPVDDVFEPEFVVDGIEEKRRISVNQIGSPGMIGMAVGKRFIHYKLLEAIAVGEGIIRALPYYSPRVMEIGGGSGTLAMWIRRASLSEAYHMVDIPTVSVFQAYTLAMEGHSIWLAGEHNNKTAEFYIHGPEPDREMIRGMDIVINQNSMPEMTPSEQGRYIGIIESCLSFGGLFFSHNHESPRSLQTSVGTAMKRADQMVLVNRYPAWCRPGYVEEIWRKIHPYENANRIPIA